MNSAAFEWEREWTAAAQCLPHEAIPTGMDRWERYWDAVASSYGMHDIAEKDLVRRITDMLLHEGIMRQGDVVLDVGCGPGTQAIDFARYASSVTCLDASSKMLERLAESKKRENVGNVTEKHGRWEDMREGAKFDLVFSSFCPALNSKEMLLKMERISHRHCCYVAISDSFQAQTVSDLWLALEGREFSNQGYDIIYPFNLLYALDRGPSLKVFTVSSRFEAPVEQMVQNEIAYFSMFMKVEPRMERIIREYFEQGSSNGHVVNETLRRFGLLYWEVESL
jgi:ubiquinone/menaquinone biosynthesis C-methylase UbiE